LFPTVTNERVLAATFRSCDADTICERTAFDDESVPACTRPVATRLPLEEA
jgi:hypothetical protein